MLNSVGERTPPCGTPVLNGRCLDVSGDDVCCSVVFGTLVGVFGLPLHHIHIPSPFTSIMDIKN